MNNNAHKAVDVINNQQKVNTDEKMKGKGEDNNDNVSEMTYETDLNGK